MNCQLLQQVIAQNQQLAESIQQQLDQINETGQASKNQLQQLENSLAEALAQSEQSLTTFAPDFKEAFNLVVYYKYSDSIENFYGKNIQTIFQLANGDVLAVGIMGEKAHLLQLQPDGSYKYSDKIEDFDDYTYINLQLADGRVLEVRNDGKGHLLEPLALSAQDIRDRAEEILK